MITFKQFITERFVNAIHDVEVKEKYKMQVWNLLQKSYAKIGGIKGNGFGSPDDMVKNIDFWKMAIKDGTVEAVIMYKDRGGRKSVAMGSTGTSWARTKVADMLKSDIYRSYGEKSKSALGLLMNLHAWEILVHFIMPLKEVAKKEKITPIKDVPKKDWPVDAVETIKRFPHLIEYGYMRKIGDEDIFKVMFGTTGNSIV